MASIVATPAQQPGTGSGQQQIKKHSAVTKVHIRDGKTIKVNDHVYISAPWAPGAGEPYLIARVMEFVTASSARAGAAALASSSGTLQVRANLYLRVRDVSHRVTNDPRLLLATMHSDLFALDNVRGLCEVRHRELIGDGSAPDVTAWKRREDHFYFHQLYDRYIHRFYDVIPMSKIKNAPADVLLALNARYSFVVAEVGMAADLCDALRGCAVCHQWAPPAESVRCDTCRTYYHMKCLNPPLLVKPSKGYSWSCASCSKKHEDDVGAYASGGPLPQNPLAPGTITEIDSEKEKEREKLEAAEKRKGYKPQVKSQPRGRNSSRRRGDREGLSLDGSMTPNGSPAPEKSLDDIRGTRCFNNWPYRYFGQHTAAPDVLDPHDSIYPRATTRLGPKFQAGLPTWEEQQAIGVGTSVAAWGKRKEAIDAESSKDRGEDSVMQDGEAAKAANVGSESVQGVEDNNGKGVGTAGGVEAEKSEGDPSRAASPSSVAHSRSGTAERNLAAQPDTPSKNGVVQPISSVEGRARELTAGDDPASSAPPSRENTPGAPPVKKGRGRPRKYPSASAKVVHSEEPSSETGTRDDASEADVEEDVNRGSDEMIQVIWAPLEAVNDALLDAYLSSVRQHFSSVPGCHIDLIDGALEILYKNRGDAVQALAEASASDLQKGFLVTEWSPKEKKAFEVAIKEFSAEMKSLKKRITTRKPAEIVRYFAHWKNAKLAQQNSLETSDPDLEEDSAPEEEDKTSTKEKGKRRAAPTRVRVTSSSRAVSPAMSIFPPDPPRSKSRVCQMCSTSSSPFWYKGPFAWQNRSLCSSCGLYWRKYAAESSIAESIVASHKRQAAAMAGSEEKELGVVPPPVKMMRTSREMKAAQPTPVTEKPAVPVKCLFCRRIQPTKKLEQCTQCSMSAHQGCYGIAMENLSGEDGWRCDACANEKALDAALIPRCVLCPKPKEPEEGEEQTPGRVSPELSYDASDRSQGNSLVRRSKQGRPASEAKNSGEQSAAGAGGISALEAFKATECNNWAHFICALWTPDVYFSDTKKMSLVEGAGNLPPERYEAECEICGIKGGACITCSHALCSRTFHAACAWAQQPAYILGFEIKAPEKGKRDSKRDIVVTFKGETGVMSAQAWCKRHKDASKSRKLYDMGESDPKTGLTTVQTYARSYKEVRVPDVPSTEPFALLRKARRLDRELIHRAGPEIEYPKLEDGVPCTTPNAQWMMRFSPEIPSEELVEQLLKGPPKRNCFKCGADGSPVWWELDEEDNVLIPHSAVDEEEDQVEILSQIEAEYSAPRGPPNSKDLSPLGRIDESARVICNGCRCGFPSRKTTARRSASALIGAPSKTETLRVGNDPNQVMESRLQINGHGEETSKPTSPPSSPSTNQTLRKSFTSQVENPVVSEFEPKASSRMDLDRDQRHSPENHVEHANQSQNNGFANRSMDLD